MSGAEYERLATEEEELFHYGTPRHSGRYPWGSGETPMQSGRDFRGTVNQLKRQGLTEKAIAKSLGFESVTQLRARVSIEASEARRDKAAQALRLQEKGMSNVAIGRQMGIPESSVRSLLNPALSAKRDVLQNTADFLKDQVDKGVYLDIGKGTEAWRGISATKLKTAAAILQEKGYEIHNVQTPQAFGKGKTTVKVLVAPGVTKGDVLRNMGNIRVADGYTPDGGHTFEAIKPPVSVNSKRVSVRYAGEGGEKADGVIYLRPGVPDLSLGSSRYAQVRIGVDGTHYLKGMAMYKKDLPPGTDILFNTSKTNTGNKFDAMKPAEGEKGALWPTQVRLDRQRTYIDSNGQKHQSPINIVNEQGDWRVWRPSLSSQVLSKQHPDLAKKQLGLAYDQKKADFDEIMSLTNPVVRKKLLLTFGDEADAASVNLKAHALPRQNTHVILPFDKIKENEVYAPNYDNGERVALIRHPHGGVFEIPVLTVNNRTAEARASIGRAPDAIGIHYSVAKRLSGADFDGDAVLVIPNNRRELKTAPSIKSLLDFDPRISYPAREGMVHMTKAGKQMHMGDVSNLITDMTIKGAKPDEIARAVKHSMVVIDAVNHDYDYTRSYKDFGIRELKLKYQGPLSEKGRLPGASTLISKARAKERIPQRTPRPYIEGGPIDIATGRKVYKETGRMTIDRMGRPVLRREKIAKLARVSDARELVSKDQTSIELIYAEHSNKLKALGNRARFEAVRTGGIKYSSSASKTYASEVASLNAKLNKAYKNAPLERQAQLISKGLMAVKTRDNPDMDDDSRRKARAQTLRIARDRVGAHKDQIEITNKEWEAIQSGAISSHRLNEILNNANLERVKELATPRAHTGVPNYKLSIARARLDQGYTQAQVAKSLGISVTALSNALAND